jgi:hypothetical protein
MARDGAGEDCRTTGTVLVAYPTSDGGCHRPPTTECPAMITFLGTILFVTILYIGSLDGRSGLSLFGKYTSTFAAGDRWRPGPGRRGRGDGRAGSD